MFSGILEISAAYAPQKVLKHIQWEVDVKDG